MKLLEVLVTCNFFSSSKVKHNSLSKQNNSRCALHKDKDTMLSSVSSQVMW